MSFTTVQNSAACAALDVEWTTILKIQAKVGNWMASLVPKARLVPAVRPEDMSADPEVVSDSNRIQRTVETKRSRIRANCWCWMV